MGAKSHHKIRTLCKKKKGPPWNQSKNKLTSVIKHYICKLPFHGCWQKIRGPHQRSKGFYCLWHSKQHGLPAHAGSRSRSGQRRAAGAQFRPSSESEQQLVKPELQEPKPLKQTDRPSSQRETSLLYWTINKSSLCPWGSYFIFQACSLPRDSWKDSPEQSRQCLCS